MILSDRDIRDALLGGHLGITPMDDPERQIQPCSVDLRLSNVLFVCLAHTEPYLDPRNPKSVGYEQWVDTCFILPPGAFILGSTIERVRVPNDLLARVDWRKGEK